MNSVSTWIRHHLFGAPPIELKQAMDKANDVEAEARRLRWRISQIKQCPDPLAELLKGVRESDISDVQERDHA